MIPNELISLAVPALSAALTILALVMAVERTIRMLGKIRRPRFFISFSNKRRHKETKRIEEITAEKIFRIIQTHGNALKRISHAESSISYETMVSHIQRKYPGLK